MARRENVYVIKRVPVSGTDPEADEAYKELNLPNPNIYVGEITAEIRLFFPPHTPYTKVLKALEEAEAEAEAKYVKDHAQEQIRRKYLGKEGA